MTCDWTRWTQKVHELPAKEDCARVWYRATFLGQMVEIEVIYALSDLLIT